MQVFSSIRILVDRHYENLPMQYTENLCALKIENFQQKNFDIFAKIREIGIPLHTPVLLYKSGVQGRIHYTDMFS